MSCCTLNVLLLESRGEIGELEVVLDPLEYTDALQIQKISLHLELVIIDTLLDLKSYKIFNCRSTYLVEEDRINWHDGSANSKMLRFQQCGALLIKRCLSSLRCKIRSP